MFKMKMIDLLQTEELDVSGALLAMQETKDSLQRIRRTENVIDDEVQAAFASQFNVNAEAEFQRIHRTRVPPRRLDPMQVPKPRQICLWLRFIEKRFPFSRHNGGGVLSKDKWP